MDGFYNSVLLVSPTVGSLTWAGELLTGQSIKESSTFLIRRVMTGTCPILRPIYGWTILGSAWVSRQKLWMDGGAGFPYLAASHFNGAHYAVWTRGVKRSAVETHRGLCLSSARIWSLGFSPNLHGEKKQGKALKEAWRSCESIRENKRTSLDLLVKEIFVHNSWNVQQGVPHPKERVFTVQGQKQTVSLWLPLVKSAQRSFTRLWPNWIRSVLLWVARYCFRYWPWIRTSAQHMLAENATTSKITPIHLGKTEVFNCPGRLNSLLICGCFKRREIFNQYGKNKMKLQIKDHNSNYFMHFRRQFEIQPAFTQKNTFSIFCKSGPGR